MYFHKMLGNRDRSIDRKYSMEGKAILKDFVEYLADVGRYDEALAVCQVSRCSSHLSGTE